MFDLVRLHSAAKQRDMVQFIEENEFSQSYMYADLISEDLIYPIVGIKDGYTFKATAKRAYAIGSMHKHFNKKAGRGEQNWNDFYYSDICKTIDEFVEKYSFISDFQITQLEFGFNLDLDQLKINGSVKKLIIDCFHFYDWTVLPNEHIYPNEGYMREFKRTQYSIKVYSKSAHYRLKGKRILRIELKMVNKKKYSELGIYNLEHLKNKESIQALWGLFMERFENLMIVDPIRPDKRSIWKNEVFKYLSPNYWKSFSRSQKDTLGRHKEAAIMLLNKKELLSIKEKLRKGLEAKYTQLLEGVSKHEEIRTDSILSINGNSLQLETEFDQRGGEYEY